jgi:glutamine amidotransferase
MSNQEVAVIDYGVGNLLSVSRGLEHCGAKVRVTSEPEVILSASRVVLPGVGAFANGMAELGRNGLDQVVLEVAASETPLLGICLGMQMLFDESEEFGDTRGLGLIPGKVITIPSTTIDNLPQKVPHIGWNSLQFPSGRDNWENTLLRKIKPGDAVYFVHSYMVSPSDSKDLLADCYYGGRSISAAVEKDNICGTQFHPEKSGKVGLAILGSFLSL